MPEIDPQLTNERKRIIRKKKKVFNQFVNIILWMVAFFIVSVFTVFTNQISQVTTISVENVSIILRALTAIFLVGFFISFLNSMIRKRFEISYEDSLFLKIYGTLDKIDAYITDSNEEYRKNAQYAIDRLMYEIELWDTGSLKVCQMEMNPHIVPFKEAFYRKVVGTSQQWEKNDWQKTFIILTEFAKFLANPAPRIEGLDIITALMNKEISVTLPAKSSEKKNISINNIMKIPMFKHTLWILLFVVVGVTLGYVGYWMHVPIEYDYVEAIAVPLALTTVYFAYIKKQT